MLNKKLVLASAIAAGLTLPAHADTLGVYFGAQAWQNEADGGFAEDTNLLDFSFEEETSASIYVKFEHPVPLVPNVRLRTGKLEGNGNTPLASDFEFGGQVFKTGRNLVTNLDFANSDITLYWELLDNDLVGFDFGLTAKYLSGDFDVEDDQGQVSAEDASLWIPMGYVATRIGIPATGIFAYGDVNLISYDDNSIHDYEVGVGYKFVDNMAVDAALTVGYREVSIEIDDVDDIFANLEFSGYFAGVEVHF